jgi:hypothetical protein
VIQSTEREIRDAIIAYLRRRGIDAKSEKRLTDPDDRTEFAQADIHFAHKGITWFLEVKRNAMLGRTLSPVQQALGQSLHYLALASFNDYDPAKVRVAIVVAAGQPADSFIEACERAGVEFWVWHDRHLTWRRSDSLRPLLGALRSRHPLTGRQALTASIT